MDLNTVTDIIRPADRGAVPPPRAGDAFLAGSTWLFSEPQTHLRRLIDLSALPWPELLTDAQGLHIPANCTLAELRDLQTPPDWRAGGVIAQCCNALLGSFKIAAVATVGGNLCLALPAAPMAALAVALHGVCAIWQPDGGTRVVDAADFITGPLTTVLAPGEILRSITVPYAALRRRAAFRQMSLTTLGRSAALLIGTEGDGAFELTITAATPRPWRLSFATRPDPATLAHEIDAAIPQWLNDVHGAPAWRHRITHILAAEILAELTAPPPGRSP